MIEHHYKFKVALFGTPRVGKTAICKRLVDPQSAINIAPSVGVQVHRKTIYPEPPQRIDVQLYDSSGQQNYFSLTKQAVRNAAITLVVFDIGDRKSFEDVEKYVIRIQDMMHHQARIVLIGNKHDLINKEGAVQQDEARQLQARLGLHDYMEVSALSGHNINYALQKPIQDFLHDILNKPDFVLDQYFAGIKNMKVKLKLNSILLDEQKKKQEQKRRWWLCGN